MVFMWLLAHSGIQGNENMDKLVKEVVGRERVEMIISQTVATVSGERDKRKTHQDVDV